MYEGLQNDPRPELVQDSKIWQRLLRATMALEDRDKAERLLIGMWQIRALGAQIRPSRDGFRIAPLLQPDGAWESEAEYKDVAGRHLGDCAAEIKQLIQQVTKR